MIAADLIMIATRDPNALLDEMPEDRHLLRRATSVRAPVGHPPGFIFSAWGKFDFELRPGN